MFSNIKYNKNALESERLGRPDEDEGGVVEEDEVDGTPRFSKLLAKEVGKIGGSVKLSPVPVGKSKVPTKVNPAFGSSVAEG
jgi:hypothetical protein